MACIVEGKVKPWPFKNIAYLINTVDFPVNSGDYSEIKAAIDHIKNNTNVNLSERTTETDFMVFVKGESCQTYVGFRKHHSNENPPPLYRHLIQCEKPSKKGVLHEICHALGLWHEQSRQDRDDYISVRFGRIGKGKRHNFYRHKKDGIDFGIYDYNSIMHYPRVSGFETFWVINKQIAGQQSKSTPALADYNRNLHMVHLGNTSNDLWHSWFDGSNWTENVRVPNQKSKTTPSLAAFNGNLHMVHLGDSSNDIWHSEFDGNSWTTNVRIPNQKSKAAPSLAVYNGNLHIVHLGNSSNDIWHSWFDGNNWTANVRIPNQKSKVAPSIAAINLGRFKNKLHIVHLGDSTNNIWHSEFNGSNWTDNVRIYQESKASPSITLSNNKLYISHLGDSSNDIWYSWYDDIPFESIWAPLTINIGQSTELSQMDIEAINFLYK